MSILKLANFLEFNSKCMMSLSHEFSVKNNKFLAKDALIMIFEVNKFILGCTIILKLKLHIFIFNNCTFYS